MRSFSSDFFRKVPVGSVCAFLYQKMFPLSWVKKKKFFFEYLFSLDYLYVVSECYDSCFINGEMKIPTVWVNCSFRE